MHSSIKSILVALTTMLLTTGSLAAPQQPDQIGCTGNQLASLDSLASARRNLHDNYCRNTPVMQYGKIASAYSDDGKVVAFMCNYGGDNPCVPSEMDADFNVLQAKCGTQGGWYHHKDWAKTYGYDDRWPKDAGGACTNL